MTDHQPDHQPPCPARDRGCQVKAYCYPGMCARLRDYLAAEVAAGEVHQPVEDGEDWGAVAI